MYVYAATVDRLIMYESHCGKFFRFFKISFFKYGIFEIVMLIELGLTSMVFNGSKNLVIVKVIQFVRAVGTSYDCCKVPLVWIFVINYFLKDICSLFNVKQVEIQFIS